MFFSFFFRVVFVCIIVIFKFERELFKQDKNYTHTTQHFNLETSDQDYSLKGKIKKIVISFKMMEWHNYQHHSKNFAGLHRVCKVLTLDLLKFRKSTYANKN